MAGGSDINNELTLNVSDFTQGLERATKKLDSFNTKLDSLDNKSEKLEKDFKDLGNNASQAAKNMEKVGASAKSADTSISALVKEAQDGKKAFESMSEWTNHYGQSLDTLRPKMDALKKSSAELHSVTARSTAEEVKAIQSGIQSRAKDLQDEQRVISERIKARKQMIAQLEQLERRSETSAAYARADAYKINKDGKEVPRYRGKNISRQRELEAEIATYQKEAQVIRQQKEHISAIVGEMEYRNAEISKAIAGEKQLLQANEQQLEAQRKARQEAQKLASEKKEQAKQASQQAKQLARETAEAEKQAAKDVLNAQRQAHKELMAMRREEMQTHKDMAALAAGVATAGVTAKGVGQIADYQNTNSRVKAINLSPEEEARFRDKSWSMAATEKFLSRTEALQTRLDALTAIGYNKEGTIDKTVNSAARNAYILRSLGYETNDFSDVVKNLYGFAEARQVMDRPDEVNKSFDIARRIGVASGGKIKMADIETVARNIGDLRQTMSSEGWVRLAAVMEQFKTAGGGNGGGGGVASVGTIFKMMSLYASGKPLTNGAAVKLLGANVMNEAFEDGSGQEFKNSSAANQAFVKAVKSAGFKDIKSMSKDPVKFFTGLRGQLLDYMMQGSQFKQYFGADAQKHTYNKQGQMIGADGKIVNQSEQDNVENAAFKRFFAQMGLSNKAIDGMLLTTNRSFAERSYHAADTAMNSKDEFQMMEDLSNNWKANMDALKASLADFAITFEPLLSQLVAIPKGLSNVIRSLSEFGKEHNGIASVALAFVGLKVASLALNGPLARIGKSLLGLVAPGKSVVSSVGSMLTAIGLFGSKAKDTATATSALGKASETAGKAGSSGFSKFLGGATGAATGVGGAIGSILRVVGLLVSWVGWAALAVMFGSLILRWVSDIKVGDTTIGQSASNMMASFGSAIANGINNARLMFWEFIQGVIGQTEFVSERIRQVRQDAKNAEAASAGLTGKTKQDIANESHAKVVNLVRSKEAGYTTTKRQYVAGTSGVGDVPGTQGGYQNVTTVHKGSVTAYEKSLANRSLAYLKNQGLTVNSNGKVVPIAPQKPVASSTKVHTELPDSRLPGRSNPVDKTGLLTPASAKKKKSGGGGGDFVPQNAYETSLAALKEESARDGSRIKELLGGAVNYDFLAREAFKKEWMQGKLDDGRDPSKRKFANRAYKKGVDWTENDINWDDQKVKAWVDLKKGNLQGDGLQKSLEFAAGKLGEAVENSQMAYEKWNTNTDIPSQTQKARKDFAKFEAKNGSASENKEYQDYKLEALSRIAAANYAELGTELREQNRELQDGFLEDETKALRNSEERRYKSEINKIKAVRDSLDEQISLVESNFGKEDKLYQELVETRKLAEAEITKNLEYQERLRVKNTRSAYDQTMATWRDLESNLGGILSSYGERAGTDIWDIITGEQDLDIKGYLSDMTREVGGSFFKQAWGNASKFIMGEGQGTSVIDVVKNFAAGKTQDESSWLGRFINGQTEKGGNGGILSTVLGKAQGLFAKIFGTKGATAKELTGDQATNANTSALQALTQALTNFAVKAKLIDTPVALPSSEAPEGTTIIPMQDRVAVDPKEGVARSGIFSNMFTSIKSGFSSLFSTDTEGGVFTKIKTGFTNLFASGGSLMSNIGANFQSMASAVGSIFTSLFGGEQGSTSSRLGGAASGAINGYASGGWAGAIVGGISGALQSKNGNAFGSSGHIQKFANGGAFTNGLYTSPTFFKFANGGSFSDGVMGEAGPEAVMPLQRDGSGRLGVAVNGGTSGTTNNVSININVAKDGSTSSSSESSASSESQQWKQMSNRVRMVVVEELVKQKRPGGALA